MVEVADPGVGAELHHAEGHGRSGKEIDPSARPLAGADQGKAVGSHTVVEHEVDPATHAKLLARLTDDIARG